MERALTVGGDLSVLKKVLQFKMQPESFGIFAVEALLSKALVGRRGTYLLDV